MTTAFLGGDPGNSSMMNRADLMSLSTINQKNDNAKTTTKKLQTTRLDSNNLNTNDIAGKY